MFTLHFVLKRCIMYAIEKAFYLECIFRNISVSSMDSFFLHRRRCSQIAHYNHIKGSSKRPEYFENYIVKFKILVLTSKLCFSEPNSSKDVRVKSLFLNSTLVSKILLRKLDWTRAKFWQCKR